MPFCLDVEDTRYSAHVASLSECRNAAEPRKKEPLATLKLQCKTVPWLHTNTIQLALITSNHKLNVQADTLKIYLNPLKLLLFYPSSFCNKTISQPLCIALKGWFAKRPANRLPHYTIPHSTKRQPVWLVNVSVWMFAPQKQALKDKKPNSAVTMTS